MNPATDFYENCENNNDIMNEENEPNQLNTGKAALNENKPIVNMSHLDIDNNAPKDSYFGKFAVDEEEKSVTTVMTVETVTVEKEDDDWKVPSKQARIDLCKVRAGIEEHDGMWRWCD